MFFNRVSPSASLTHVGASSGEYRAKIPMLAPTRGCFLGGIYCKESHAGAGTWVLPRGNIWSKITLPAHPPAEVADEVAGVYPGAPRTLWGRLGSLFGCLRVASAALFRRIRIQIRGHVVLRLDFQLIFQFFDRGAYRFLVFFRSCFR